MTSNNTAKMEFTLENVIRLAKLHSPWRLVKSETIRNNHSECPITAAVNVLLGKRAFIMNTARACKAVAWDDESLRIHIVQASDLKPGYDPDVRATLLE